MGARVVQLSDVVADLGRAVAAAGRELRAGGLVPEPQRRPAVPVFVAGRANRCPDCHGEAFIVGRVTAECGGCELPLAIVHCRRAI
jgi:hypothetical protein